MEKTWSFLISNLITDTQDLIKTEVELLNAGIREGVQDKMHALRILAVGLGLIAVGGVFLLGALSEWIHVQAEIPLSSSLALVGLAVVGAGAFLAYQYGFKKHNNSKS